MSRWRTLLLLPITTVWMVSGAGHVDVQGSQENDGLWQVVDGRALTAQRTDLVGAFRVLRLNQARLDERLQDAPMEADAAEPSRARLTLPVPEGGFHEFSIEESPILAPELGAEFPEIRTYRGVSLTNPSVTTRFDWTPDGFHAIVFGDGDTIYVDPAERGNIQDYVVYRRASSRGGDTPFSCLIDGDARPSAWRPLGQFPFTNGTTRRTYRLALAATGEYTAAAGGTKPAALSRMTTTMNRVNGIYERDLAVRLTMSTGTVADTTALIYTNGASDPYSNANGGTMLAQNQATLDAVVGFGNYDMGHVFSTGGGGVAYLGAVCGANKGGGVTGSSSPTGDGFDVDYVAHEMGHQFGANHTFNGTSGSCGGGNRAASHAFEPGSGSTIMSYAGICNTEDTQRNSHDYFHVDSLNEMTAFLTAGGGATCGTAAATGNVAPSVGGGGTFTIPASTPFALTASASDANGDALTYTWEQYNAGSSSNSAATASQDDGSRALFRSYAPSATPVRMFPSLPFILNNGNVPPQTFAGALGVGSVTCSYGTCLTGEALPATNRTLTFHVTVRDQRGGGGAVATLGSSLTVAASAGPFAVTWPNSALSVAGGSSQNVTWQVAGTSAAPVGVASVTISLSTDGGYSFPTVLAAGVPNSGTASVVVPNVSSTTARIKVEAVGNVFFDISNTNFTISSSGATPPVTPPGGGTPEPAPGGCSTVQVLASPPARAGVSGVEALWQSSGVTVAAGEVVTVTASGTWLNGAQAITANGDPAQAVAGSNAPLPSGAGLLALVGRIGPAGAPFLVGGSKTWTATVSGMLYVAPQDHWYLAWDNGGSLSVSVCRGGGTAPTTPPPTPTTPTTPGGTPGATICSTVQVQASPPAQAGVGGVEALWQSSGVTVTAGEVVTVTASGTWINAAQTITANGDPAQPVTGTNAPLPGAGLLALVGRIGPAGTPFLVGASTTWTAATTGVVYFAPQDNWYTAWDNRGSLSVSVCRGGSGTPGGTTPTPAPTPAGCGAGSVAANPPAAPGVGGVDVLWQSSGIAVTAGQVVTVTATGTWLNGAQALTANGDPAQAVTGGNAPLPAAGLLALIGRIGPAGAPFLVGASKTFTAAASGVMYFAPQDNWYLAWDNSGSLTVTVCR